MAHQARLTSTRNPLNQPESPFGDSSGFSGCHATPDQEREVGFGPPIRLRNALVYGFGFLCLAA